MTTSIAVLQEYLKIRTDHPNPDYKSAVQFLKKQSERVGLPVAIYGRPSKPVVVMTWTGSNPALPSVMFSSHTDVVPVYPEKWTYDPFAARKTEDGKIYGRGAQDMKSQGIQYLESVLKLKAEGYNPLRTIHLAYIPDEEIGGGEGMAEFVKSTDFKRMNVGFVIDESCASPWDFFVLFNNERAGWGLEVICTGPTAHGSLLPPDTAGHKARIVIDEFLNRRDAEMRSLDGKPNPIIELANVTTINLTMMEGGVQKNVIPDNFKLTFDIRLSVHENHDEFLQWIQDVVAKAGEGVTVNFLQQEKKVAPTKTDDSNPFWTALKSAVSKKNIVVLPLGCPGCTDSRYVREVGIPAFGFSPMRNTPVLLHSHDEYITESVFLEGIEVFVEVMRSVSSVA